MSITVVPAYRVIKKFVRDAEGLPADTALELLWSNLRTYVNHVLSGADAAFANLGQRMAVSQIGDPDPAELSAALEGLEQGRPKLLAEEALQRCSSALPRPDLNARLIILPGDGQSSVLTTQMNGVLGVSLGAYATLVFLWPTGDWQRWLVYTVAHEYAHLVRNLLFPRRASGGRMLFQKTQENETLLDAMVAEGIADAFATELYPEMKPPSCWALSPEAKQRVWPKIRRRLSHSDMAEIRRLLFGDNDRVAVWAGYTIGYDIVRCYMASHPTARPANLISMTAKAVFEASNYHPSLMTA